jgi:hypothetical protein
MYRTSLTLSCLVLHLYRVLSLVIQNSPNNGLINTILIGKVFDDVLEMHVNT